MQGLTQVEEMLISAVMPIMSVYRLPQGQYGYSGHVVNLPQDVTSFVQSLPRLPSNLDVIIVRKEGANQSHRDFRVRRGVVHRALHSTDANRRDFTILSLCTSHHIKFALISCVLNALKGNRPFSCKVEGIH